MRKILSFLVLAAPFAVACCASSNQPGADEGAGSTQPASNLVYEKALKTWIDRPEEDLVAAWGVPERSQRLTDGGQALEYRHLDSNGRVLCTTLFTSDVYGRIRTWVYRGIDCRAPHLGDYGAARS